MASRCLTRYQIIFDFPGYVPGGTTNRCIRVAANACWKALPRREMRNRITNRMEPYIDGCERFFLEFVPGRFIRLCFSLSLA